MRCSEIQCEDPHAVLALLALLTFTEVLLCTCTTTEHLYVFRFVFWLLKSLLNNVNQLVWGGSRCLPFWKGVAHAQVDKTKHRHIHIYTHTSLYTSMCVCEIVCVLVFFIVFVCVSVCHCKLVALNKNTEGQQTTAITSDTSTYTCTYLHV